MEVWCILFAFYLLKLLVLTNLQRGQAVAFDFGHKKGSRWSQSSHCDTGLIGDLSGHEEFIFAKPCRGFCLLLPNGSRSENKDIYRG